MATYYGVIHKDSDSDYGIQFPDVPGCISAGSTLEELDVMGKEALKFHLDSLEEDGEHIPEPTSSYAEIYEQYKHDEGFFGVTLVSIQRKAKRVRVNVSLPEDDLALIDTMAEKHGLDRSGFLLLAAKKVATGQCTI